MKVKIPTNVAADDKRDIESWRTWQGYDHGDRLHITSGCKHLSRRKQGEGLVAPGMILHIAPTGKNLNFFINRLRKWGVTPTSAISENSSMVMPGRPLTSALESSITTLNCHMGSGR